MRFILPRILLCLLYPLSGCSDTPIAIGSGSIRLMNGTAGNAAQAYDMAYSQMTPQHIRIRRSLDPQSFNIVGARTATERILGALETMQSRVSPEQRKRFDPYIKHYRDGFQDLRTGRPNASFMSRTDRYEREIKARLSLRTVRLAGPTPVEPPMAPKPAPVPPPGTPTSTPAEPPVASTAPPTPVKPPPPAPTGISGRLIFKAWNAAHGDLVSTYREKKNCETAYQDLAEALDLMQARLSGKDVEKLRSYHQFYEGIRTNTSGFTTLPEKTSAEDILQELEVVARWIKRAFEPTREDR